MELTSKNSDSFYVYIFFTFFFTLRYLLRAAVLAIVAYCSSSRPCELQDVRIGAFKKDETNEGIWFDKFHGKRKGGTNLLFT